VPDSWQGDCPLYLIIRVEEGATVIDLDEKGWVKTHLPLMRRAAHWYLVRKDTGAVPIAMEMLPFDRGYYTARHVAVASTVPDENGFLPRTEIIGYGLGRKRKIAGRWSRDELWCFMNGLVVAGTDVEAFGVESIHRGIA
jgi:hypothetical protein